MMCGVLSAISATACDVWRRRGLWVSGWFVAFTALAALAVLTVLAANSAWAQTTPLQTTSAPTVADPNGPTSLALPSAAQLADFLEDETARKALIERLRAVSAQEQASPVRTQPTAQTVQGDNLTQWVAARTQALLDDIAHRVGGAAQAFRDLGSLGMRSIALEHWLPILGTFALVALVTAGIFWALRRAARLIYQRMDDWVGPRDEPVAMAGCNVPDAAKAPDAARSDIALCQRMLAVIGGLVVDLATVMLAVMVGHVAAGALGVGADGIGLLDQAFLRAFLAVESAKVMVRTVFSPRFSGLRLVAASDESATYWNRWMSGLVSITGYSIMIVEPLANAMFSPAVGKLFGLLIMLAVYLYALRKIWAHRTTLRDHLLQWEHRFSTTLMSALVGVLARIWHGLAIAYFTVLFVTSQLDPMNALPFMASATLQSVAAVAAGVLLSSLLSLLLSRRIQLADTLRVRLPMLEARVNAYAPILVRAARLLVLLSVLLVVLDAWRVFDLTSWVSSDQGTRLIAVVVQILIVLLVALLVWTLVASLIEHRLGSDNPSSAPSPRERTLLALLRNAMMVLIVATTVMVLLAQIGVDIGPLLAGAGVVGLAIGFGAQKLVQDVITGIFIQIENGMNQNDVVQVAGVFGTVEKITIRSVGIRTLDGAFHLIPFSSVDTVTNHMRDFSYHLGEYTIAHRESVEDAIFHLERAFAELKQDHELAPEILEDMVIPGVTSLSERGFTIRVLIKTRPGMQWAIQRAFNRLVKKHFSAADIELPYPHTVIQFHKDKIHQGKT